MSAWYLAQVAADMNALRMRLTMYYATGGPSPILFLDIVLDVPDMF